MHVSLYPFLKCVADARGIAPFAEGDNPADVDATIHRTFGCGWNLVWNDLRKVWGIYRNFPQRPEPVYEYTTTANGGERLPLTAEPVAHIKTALELDANPGRMKLAQSLAGQAACAAAERQIQTFAFDLAKAVIHKQRMRNSIFRPGVN